MLRACCGVQGGFANNELAKGAKQRKWMDQQRFVLAATHVVNVRHYSTFFGLPLQRRAGAFAMFRPRPRATLSVGSRALSHAADAWTRRSQVLIILNGNFQVEWKILVRP
jgi:hypothetical protein